MTNTPGCFRSRSAFTLIELLTVIAIIGVLAAILIPVSGTVRASARNATCLSNQRQIVGAMHLHAADNRGFLPVASRESPSSTRWVRDPTFTVYLPLVQRSGSGSGKWENNIFVCPSVVNNAGQSGDDLRVTYAASAALYGPNGTGALGIGSGKFTQRQMSTIVNPARTVLLFDGKLILADTHTNYSYYWHEVSPDTQVAAKDTVRTHFLHAGSMNVAMVDGSARGMTHAEFALMTEGRWRGIE